MFAIIGKCRVDRALDSEELHHIVANVRQQPGFLRGYWGQEVDDVAYAHALVILDDEASAQTMAEGVRAAIPSAALHVVRCWRTRRSALTPPAPASRTLVNGTPAGVQFGT